MKCFCKMSFDEIDALYGRWNRAHVTIISGLKALKISDPIAKAKQIALAAGVLSQHDARIKEFLKEAKNAKDNDASDYCSELGPTD